MAKWILFEWTLTLALGAFSSSAWAQAAAAYGGLAAHSAAATTKAATALGSTLGQVEERQGAKLSSLENGMEANRQKLEAKGQKGGGTVHIGSVPAMAGVYVDDALVAYTPVDLKMAEGKHVIELKRPTSLPWRKEISLSPGGKLSLNPELREKYKSVLTLTIQK
jgi:PEGA domain